jgi:predicted DNA-binding transcriptional regulator YafY
MAAELEVAPRTVYRDIATLQASRVPIDGQAGVGYVLRPGYDLPPLMFSEEELEAIVLGARMAADRGDPELARAAENVLAKVGAVLPDHLSSRMWRAALLVPHRSEEAAAFGRHLPLIRKAIRGHAKIEIGYRDGQGRETARTLWPLGLYFFSHVTLVCAWCELRKGFRAFRADRIGTCTVSPQTFDAANGTLMRAFLASRTS